MFVVWDAESLGRKSCDSARLVLDLARSLVMAWDAEKFDPVSCCMKDCVWFASLKS